MVECWRNGICILIKWLTTPEQNISFNFSDGFVTIFQKKSFIVLSIPNAVNSFKVRWQKKNGTGSRYWKTKENWNDYSYYYHFLCVWNVEKVNVRG